MGDVLGRSELEIGNDFSMWCCSKYCLKSCKTALLDCTDAQERQIITESQNTLGWKDVESLAEGSCAFLGVCTCSLIALLPFPGHKLHP